MEILRSKKRFQILAGMLLLLIGAIALSFTRGSLDINIKEIYQAIIDSPEAVNRQIILNIRLPRIVLGLLVGINLSLAGMILQAVMRNPLADPQIIGVSAGAGLVGLTILIIFPNLTTMLPPFTFLGAMGASILVYILSWKDGIRPMRIILSGVAVSALFGAGISALMIFYSDRLQNAVVFMAGSLSGTSWPQVKIILPYTLLGIVLAFFLTEDLNILMLGDEAAAALGVAVNRTRVIATAIAALMAASAVSVVGLLGFVGLIVPHISRLLLGSDHRILMPGCILMGGFTLVFSDMLARNLFSPVEIPVGIIMAVLGAPVFLFLLRRSI